MPPRYHHNPPEPEPMREPDALARIRDELRRAAAMYRASRTALVSAYAYIVHVRTLLAHSDHLARAHHQLAHDLHQNRTLLLSIRDQLTTDGHHHRARALDALIARIPEAPDTPE